MKRFFLHGSVSAIFCVLIASSARADAITGYTVTDLGLGIATLSAATGANATLTAPDGKTVYSFPRTDNLVDSFSVSSSLLKQFPALTTEYSGLPNPSLGLPGDAYDNPNNIYKQYAGAIFLNANGVAALTEQSGISGHMDLAGSSVVALQRQADGSYTLINQTLTGQYVAYPGAATNSSTGGTQTQVLDLNNANQILSLTGGSTYNTLNNQNFTLTNLNTGISTNLQTLLPLWHLDNIGSGISLSDNGQILIYGDNQSTDWKPESFLLTPDGLSSTPLATPEPSTLVTLAVAGVGLVVRRRWESR